VRASSPQAVPAIAKVSRPRLVDLERRARLFRRLDKLCRDHRALWIAAPAGFGKTSLLVSYLETKKLPALWFRVDPGDAEAADLFFYLRLAVEAFEHSPRAGLALPTFAPGADVAVFARRFFEALFARLPAGALVVFDDYYLARAGSSLELAIEKGIHAIPPRVNVVVLSRYGPPGILSRACVNGDVASLEAAELRLTERETAALAKRRGGCASAGSLKRIFEQTGGWAAGVTLLLRHDRSRVEGAIGDDVQPTFDYLATAVFADLSDDSRSVLLHSAWLPWFTAEQAAALSGVPRARAELQALHRAQLFVETHGTDAEAFRCHPLFRSFLRYQAERTFGDERWRALRRRGAGLLRAAGRDEDAFDLSSELGDHDECVSVVLGRAPALVQEGRLNVLERWLVALPPELVHGDGWLCYWRATCTLTTAPAESRARFERAFDAFLAARDGRGAYLAWAGAAHALAYDCRSFLPVKDWFGRLAEVEQFCPVFPAPDVGLQVASALLMGLTLVGADAATLDGWARRAMALAENESDRLVRVMTRSVLVLHYTLRGDVTRAAALAVEFGKETNDSSAGLLARIAAYGATTLLAFFHGHPEAGLRAAHDGVRLMAGRPAPMWSSTMLVFGSTCALEQNDLASVLAFKETMAEIAQSGTTFEVASYHAICGMEAMLRKDLGGVRAAIELSYDGVRAMGFVYGQGCALSILAYTGFELGYAESARDALAAMRCLELEQHDVVIAYMRLLVEADRAHKDGARAQAAAALAEAFAIGKKWQIFGSSVPTDAELAELCRLSLEEGIEVEHVRTLVHRRKLVPLKPPLDVRDWPWPVTIRALGPLEIVLDNDEFAGFGRAKMPPLLLLSIVAHTVSGRGVAIERLVSELWPDADGDLGLHSFEVTLLRLRKALGALGKAVKVEGGRLSLDASLVWTDLLAIGAVLGEIERLDDGGRTGAARPTALAERLIELYVAPFGCDTELPPSLLGFRGRTHARVLAACERLARRLRALGELALERRLRARLSEADVEASAPLGAARSTP
jgi:LuxR family transcriptional regulator, maltose regulon positive regulatory protein